MNILDFFFPKLCLGCGRIGRYFCLDCQKAIRFVDTHECRCPMCGRQALDGITHPRCQTRYGIDGLTSFFYYDGIIRKAVKALKYRYVSHLAEEFVSLIPSFSFPRVTMIPIPLHPSRLKERGFNQAEILGKSIVRQLHIPICLDILKRVKKTDPQASIKHRKDRLDNMKDVFIVSRVPNHDSVVLFDDVFTTGATMRAAANSLKRNGVSCVWAVTMAR